MLTSLLIMMAFIAISCANNTNESADDPGYKITFDDSGNKIVTVKEGIGHFSMIYPSDFVLGVIKIDNSGGIESLSVDFIGPMTDVGLPLISIDVSDYYDSFPAKSAADSLLNQARKYNNFKLLDESTISVAGVTAYQHSYYYDTYPYDPHIIPPEDATLITWLFRRVFFDYIEFSYTLRLGSDPSREEQDMAAFDRILETFKILD